MSFDFNGGSDYDFLLNGDAGDNGDNGDNGGEDGGNIGNDFDEFETIEDDGGKFVKVPVDDFEELRKSGMALNEFQTKTQILSDLNQRLEETLSGLSSRDVMGEDGNIEDEDGDNGGGLNEAELQKRIEEIAFEKVKPVYEAEARRQVEEETAKFRQKFSNIFTGDPKEDEKIMQTVYSTAATYRKDDGSPLSLEEAFALAYRGSFSDALNYVSEAEEKKRKAWGSDGSVGGVTEPQAILSEAEADKEFHNRLMKIRGY